MHLSFSEAHGEALVRLFVSVSTLPYRLVQVSMLVVGFLALDMKILLRSGLYIPICRSGLNLIVTPILRSALGSIFPLFVQGEVFHILS
jgi:hypothetical protein